LRFDTIAIEVVLSPDRIQFPSLILLIKTQRDFRHLAFCFCLLASLLVRSMKHFAKSARGSGRGSGWHIFIVNLTSSGEMEEEEEGSTFPLLKDRKTIIRFTICGAENISDLSTEPSPYHLPPTQPRAARPHR